MKQVITVIAATLLAGGAMAGDETSKTMKNQTKTTAAAFESLDKNADQQLSKTEVAADKSLSDSFAAADANGDGYLSKSEYTARSKS